MANQKSSSTWTEAYLKLSSKLLVDDLPPVAILQKTVSTFQPLSVSQINEISLLAEENSKKSPPHGWTLGYVTFIAAELPPENNFVQGLAAWHLARMANEWNRPDLVQEALSHARPAFEKTNQSIWLAACDWQENALPWTRPNFAQAKESLSRTIKVLSGSALNHFVPECSLALAYSQLLTADYQDALDTVERAEEFFKEQNDLFNLGRCLSTRASVHRRQGQFKLALEALETATNYFRQIPAPIEIAKIQCQYGFYFLFAENDYKAACQAFEEALSIFTAHRMPLWQAICWHGLGQTHFEAGDIDLSASLLEKAQNIYTEFNIPGSLGDVLFDRAKQERLAGNYSLSIGLLEQVHQIYEDVHTPLYSAMINMHLGSTYVEAGKLQMATSHLEKASNILSTLAAPGPSAECQMRLAHVYLKTNQPEAAREQLDLAKEYYEASNRPAYLSTIYGRLAEAAFQKEDQTNTRLLLENALKTAQQHNLRPQIALTSRILGEFLTLTGTPEEGLSYLQNAADEFEEMGIFMEQVVCWLSIGNCLFKMDRNQEAEEAWQTALKTNQGTLDSIIWECHSGLAKLAQLSGTSEDALGHYREMVYALGRQRQDFWQPTLAGQFLRKPVNALNRAIATAFECHSPDEILSFIEASKAQTTVRQLSNPTHLSGTATDSAETRAAIIEIEKLNEQVHAGFRAGFGRWVEAARQNKLLMEKVATLGKLYDKLERQLQSESQPLPPIEQITPNRFRSVVQEKLKTSWIVLDYYLTETDLYGLMLTPDSSVIWKRELSASIRGILEICATARTRDLKPNSAMLKGLGRWLFPDEFIERIDPNTYLFIAPHQILHQVPWPAVRYDDTAEPLVAKCLPIIVPSLSALSLLLERESDPRPDLNGLVIAVTRFMDPSKQDLPEIWREVNAILPKLGPESRVLKNEEATWQNLKALAKERKSLEHFSFCHIASHGSFDSVAGRLSSLSLFDQEVLADQITEISPWPRLVTMAACNSAQSLIYEGDEHLSLTSNLLAAGSNTVIGSLWPVRDKDAADLLIDFYSHFFEGEKPGKALALAQRQAWQRGEVIERWGSFLCTGCPG